MTHVWFDELGCAHRSRRSAEAVDGALESIDGALKSIDEALEIVEAVSAHERFAEYESLSRERLDDILLKGGRVEETRTD
jgi:hypothetical protein